jgi:hypothetical protein
MPFSTYDELQASAVDFMKRAGQLGNAPDWITLAEAKLNRKLGPVETNASRTGTVDSRSLDISALAVVEPIALFIAAPSSANEVPLQKQAAADIPYSDISGQPSVWGMDSESSIKFDRPCDQAYAFRFRFRERFALSDSVPSNWLLDNHPDVYLAAVMMWGAGYNEAWENGQIWKQALVEGIDEVQQQISVINKGTLRVDPALTVMGSSRRLGFYTGAE